MKFLPSMAAFAFACLFVGPAGADIPIKGVETSSLRKNEDKGARYFYASGVQDDALKILRDGGANTVRLRVWVDSPDGYHGKQDILESAKRAKDLGMKVLLDFHYSDTWADPGKQGVPRAWAGFDLAKLETAVYDHTYDICAALAAQGTPADFVQIGNEINDGMLWPTGRVSTNKNNFQPLADLIRSGINGAKRASDRTAIVLHTAGFSKWLFDGVKAAGVDWDVTGVSYYTWWHGTLASLESNLALAASRYAKPVLICETSYPWTLQNGDAEPNVIGKTSQLVTGYPATMDGHYKAMRTIIDIVNRVPNGRGWGIVYWDATWTPVPGNGWDNLNPKSGNTWENQALFDYSGKETVHIFE